MKKDCGKRGKMCKKLKKEKKKNQKRISKLQRLHQFQRRNPGGGIWTFVGVLFALGVGVWFFLYSLCNMPGC